MAAPETADPVATGPLATGPLAGVKVLDLSRVLAGPFSTQILADLGADVIKVEQPGQGDDTRRWGPPFLEDGSRDSAYYLCANRNKRSVAINMADPRGADLIRELAKDVDIVVENFRVGGLAKYGLDYDSLAAINPRLVYCSITGFGQTGPYKDRGGYDFLIQGMSGLMSITGRPDEEAGGGPMKVGLPICDLVTGLYSVISILAALRHRDETGEGQQIDMALLDAQLSLLANQGSNYLNGGMIPRRMGNEHPNTVPYQDFSCSDGDILLPLGNDKQLRQFCAIIGRPDIPDDPRFIDNAARNANRAALQAELRKEIGKWKSDDLIAAMEAVKLPCGKVNEIPQILADPHVAAREMVQDLNRSDGTPVKFIGYPAKFSKTKVNYRIAPPRSGEDTEAVLKQLLSLDAASFSALIEAKVVATEL